MFKGQGLEGILNDKNEIENYYVLDISKYYVYNFFFY